MTTTQAEHLCQYLKAMKDTNWREYWAAIDWICFNIKDISDDDFDQILLNGYLVKK